MRPESEDERRAECTLWREAFAEDYRRNISAFQMHEHRDTCFKYKIQEGVRKAKHCRFNFNHFVTLAVKTAVDGVTKVRDIVFARTGKDLVLPRPMTDDGPEPAPSMVQFDPDTGDQIALRPTTELGPTVITSQERGMLGRVKPIRWNPLEGSSNAPAMVATRGNLDYQSMLRTFDNGFEDFNRGGRASRSPAERCRSSRARTARGRGIHSAVASFDPSNPA